MGGWSCHWIWGAEGQGVKVRQRHDSMTHSDKRRILRTGFPHKDEPEELHTHTYTLRPELGLITNPTVRKHIMIFLVITSLMQEVLAVAGVGEYNISFHFTTN